MANAIDVHTLRSVGSSQLDRSSPAQEDPAIASNGRNYFAVWSEPPELRAGRINLEGEPLDGRGTCIPAFSDTQGNRSPRVLFDG